MALTYEQKLARNALAEDIRRRRPGTSYVAAITEASRAVRRTSAAPVNATAAASAAAIAEAAIAAHQAARKSRKAARRAVREQGLTAAAVLGTQPRPAAAGAALGPLADKPLHEMSRQELASVAAAGTTGASPFLGEFPGSDVPMRSPFWKGMTGA